MEDALSILGFPMGRFWTRGPLWYHNKAILVTYEDLGFVMPRQGAGRSTPVRCRWGGSFFEVSIPDKLPTTLRRVAAGFLALHPSWLDVRWDDGDLLLSWSDEAPLLTRDVRDRLRALAAEFPSYKKRGLAGQQITVASLPL
eukprot:4150700-Amphidinium_carterae.2